MMGKVGLVAFFVAPSLGFAQSLILVILILSVVGLHCPSDL